MPKKTLLLDCDGVLLDYDKAFFQYVKHLGISKKKVKSSLKEDILDLEPKKVKELINKFNESDHTRNLEEIRDAKKYLQKLQLINFEFICITSIGTSDRIKENRIFNLGKVFGDKFFKKIHFVPTFSSKEFILQSYRNKLCVFIDDNEKDCITAKKYKMTAYQFCKKQNTVENVASWKNLYSKVILI